MKKILLFLISFLFISYNAFWAYDCDYDWSSVSNSLSFCLEWSDLVDSWDWTIEWGFRETIIKWTNNIAVYLWILAVFAIVYWSAMLTFSAWEDEKVNKAKSIIKWAILWFIWLLFASTIINVLVKVIYSL